MENSVRALEMQPAPREDPVGVAGTAMRQALSKDMAPSLLGDRRNA